MHLSKFIFLLLLLPIFFSVADITDGSGIDKVLDSLNQDLVETINSGDSLNIARKYYKQSKFYDKTGDHQTECEYLEKAFAYVSDTANDKAKAIISNSLAGCYSVLGLPEKSLQHYQFSAEMFLAVKDTMHTAVVYSNISSVYRELGHYEDALAFGFKALKINQSFKDSVNIAGSYRVVAEIYKFLKENENFERYLLKAKALADLHKDTDYYIKVSILNDLGGMYELRGDDLKALQVYNDLYAICRGNKHTSGMGTSLSNKAVVLKKLKRYREALLCYREIYENEWSERTPLAKFYYFNGIGSLYDEQNNLKNAILAHDSALVIATRNRFAEETEMSYRELYKLYKKQGRFDLALKYHERHKTINDSLKGVEKQKLVAGLQVKYESDKQKYEIKLLNRESKLQKAEIRGKKYMTYALIGLAFLITIISLLIIFYRQLKHENDQSLLKDKLFRAQMNPHFIFNCLASVQSFMYKQDLKNAARYLSDFSTLIRGVLKNSREELISIEDEVKSLGSYLSLEQLRHNNSFSYEIKVDESIETEFESLPPMLIQPFVENSIKHGFKNCEYKGRICVEIGKDGERLKISVSDNGTGIKEGIGGRKKHVSYAMQIFTDRIQLLQKKYAGTTVHLENGSEDENSGLRVCFVLPAC